VKRTPEDDLYAERFGEHLEEAYRAAKSKEVTDQTFADSIGVKRSQLRKYLRGASVPSVRTVALALRNYGIKVAYEDVQVAKVVGGKRTGGRLLPRLVQLRLPFSLDVTDPDKFEVELKSLKPRRYELRIRVKKAG
jgi:transcriptional regulator with XRE-family HTH domain